MLRIQRKRVIIIIACEAARNRFILCVFVWNEYSLFEWCKRFNSYWKFFMAEKSKETSFQIDNVLKLSKGKHSPQQCNEVWCHTITQWKGVNPGAFGGRYVHVMIKATQTFKLSVIYSQNGRDVAGRHLPPPEGATLVKSGSFNMGFTETN